jgi:hypothetical protein
MLLLTDVERLGSQNLGGVQYLAQTGKARDSAALHRPRCESARDMTNVGSRR